MGDDDLITTENRRLSEENVRLRARVDAFESSRWWRLHPRFLFPGLGRGVPSQAAQSAERTKKSEHPKTSDRTADPLAQRFREDVIARGSFSADWFTGHVASWEPILGDLDGRQARILEIGSFEGLSACYLLWRLPEARLTCVDTFEGSPENIAYGDLPINLEERFKRNVALVNSARVRMLRGESRRVLSDLLVADERFDLVYVDGSHLALDVLVDASLSWQLLEPGGVAIFDDYGWTKLGDDPLLRPGPAIDAFLHIVERHSETLFQGGEVALRKTA